jgi:NADPH oxidase 2
MATKRSSGLDFSDKRMTLDGLAAHPDVLQRAPNSTNLQRNKTERHRLQGLMRNVSSNDENRFRVGFGSNSGGAAGASTGDKIMNKLKDEKLMDRWHTWLINGGRSKILFGVYILLHLVVFTMGFLQYQLKDNNSNARSEVGLGFGESVSLFVPLGSRSAVTVAVVIGSPASQWGAHYPC